MRSLSTLDGATSKDFCIDRTSVYVNSTHCLMSHDEVFGDQRVTGPSLTEVANLKCEIKFDLGVCWRVFSITYMSYVMHIYTWVLYIDISN